MILHIPVVLLSIDFSQIEDINKIYRSLSDKEKKDVAPRGNLKEYRDMPNHFRIVYKDKGFVDVSKFTGPDSGFVTIAVNPKYRDKGIASQLMQDTIKKAKDKGLKSLDWITETDNVASQKLAEKSGFTLISRDKKEVKYRRDL